MSGSSCEKKDPRARAQPHGPGGSRDSLAQAVAWPVRSRPGFLARRLHQIHVSLFTEICAAFKTTPLQYSLLCALVEQGPADQTSLAAAVDLDRTTTTGILKRLQARGLVERATSDQDRRAQDCRLTPAGRLLLARMEAPAEEAHRRTLEALTAAERDLFMTMIGKVVAANAERHQDPSCPEERDAPYGVEP